ATAVLALRAAQSRIGFAAALQRNDNVLVLGHPLRTASETALDLLATRESSPDFASEAAADLFGRRPTAADALIIRAKRDWVLFHRRRNKQCGAGPTPQPVEERRYQLYHLRVKTEAQLRSARAAVISANAERITKLGFTPFGVAAFEGGRSQLATPTAALLADWDAAQPGNRLRFGAIGSQGAAQAEGDALAKSRLATLELTLARGQPVANVENQVLAVLPALSLAGWDGAVFLLTLDEQIICHDVYRVAGDDAFGRFVGLAEKNGVSAAIAEFQLKPLLAHVDYAEDGKALQPASVLALRSAWGVAGKPLDKAVGYYLGSKADAAEAAATTLQSQAVMGALDGNTSDVFVRHTPDLGQVTTCRGITVLAQRVEQQVTPVLLAHVPFDGGFLIGPNTAFEQAKQVDGVPAELEHWVAIVRTLLTNNPNAVAVGVKTAPEMAMAKALL
ncbi:MAG: hypothetical protein Q8L92_13995, partial [Rubrivivax sp.]|nr:hypothetical protein [Rubrivivax sp.]